MKAIILAGGFGERTKGILNGLPKTLVKTGDGRTILDHTLDDLQNITDIKDIAIVTNASYFDHIYSHINSFHKKRSIKVLSNGQADPQKRLGALGDLLFAYNEIKSSDDSCLVLPSDNAYWNSFSLKSFINSAKSNPKDFFIIARKVTSPGIIKNRFGCVVLNGKNEVVNFVEKPEIPPSLYAATPFYIYQKEHFELLKNYRQEGGNLDSPGRFIPYLITQGKIIKAMITGDNIIDAGTPRDIEITSKY